MLTTCQWGQCWAGATASVPSSTSPGLMHHWHRQPTTPLVSLKTLCQQQTLSALSCRHFEYIYHYSTLNSLFVNIISYECAEMTWTCHGTGSSPSYQSVGVASSHSEHLSVQGLVPPYVTSCQHCSWLSVTNDAVHSACPASVTHQRVHKLTSLLTYTQHVSLTFTST